MHVATIGATPRRRVPVLGGPEVEMLTATDGSDWVAMVHREIPADVAMPEHDRGPSRIVVVLLSGVVRVTGGGTESRLAPGFVAHTARGERLSVTDSGNRTRRADACRVARRLCRVTRRAAAGMTGVHRCACGRPHRRVRRAPTVGFRRRSDRAVL